MVVIHVYHALPGDARRERRNGSEDSGLRHIVLSRTDGFDLLRNDVSSTRLWMRSVFTRA